MNDFETAMAAKSDQISASDLIAGDMTVTIAGVKVTPGTEQPVSITLQGHSKVWRPCKTTGRILMAAWGKDTAQYVGRSVQLYLDPKVKWGGLEVGGIRIRAISHIESDLRLVLAESKQVRKPVTVKRLDVGATTQKESAPKIAPALSQSEYLRLATAAAGKGTSAFRAWFNTDQGKDARASGALTVKEMADLQKACAVADSARDADPFGLPPVSQTIDAELSAQIAAEIAARDRMEGQE